jgi:hypothetical protein
LFSEFSALFFARLKTSNGHRASAQAEKLLYLCLRLVLLLGGLFVAL